MRHLLFELIAEICEYLTDYEKITLSMTSKSIDKMKHKLTYHEEINVRKIKTLPYFNNFQYVKISNITDAYPRHAIYIHFTATTMNISLLQDIPITHLSFAAGFDESIKNKLPLSVTHLMFNYFFNQKIKNYIPPSVTHLTFGCKFNQSIKKIPLSVTHLRLGNDFHRRDTFPSTTNITYLELHYHYCDDAIYLLPSVKYLVLLNFDCGIQYNIPRSVTHLTLHCCCGSMPACIPESVTHLTFGDIFNKSIKNVNISSVTHLRFGFGFNKSINNCIPDSVVEITLCKKYSIPINEDITSRVKIRRI